MNRERLYRAGLRWVGVSWGSGSARWRERNPADDFNRASARAS